MVADAELVGPLGTRHSFSLVGDSAGVLVSTEHLNRVVEIGDETVTVEAGIRYGELSSELESHGLALPNLGSLPHVSVGGAIATGTHGSGARNQSLSAGIASLELVRADGSISRPRRGDEDFDGAVVSLGAVGLVTRVSLDVIPSFELRQYVFEGLPWSTVEADLDAILEGAYSVSLFTSWSEPAIGQVWVKTKDRLDSQSSYFGAAPAQQPLHPIPGVDTRKLHRATRYSRPVGRAAPALPPRLHPQRRRRAPVGIRRGAQARRRRPPGAAAPRRSRITARADS